MYEEYLPTNGKQTIDVNLQLTNGKTYDIVFWADAFGEEKDVAAADKKSPFKFTQQGVVEVDYTKMLANPEKGDAFYGVCSDFYAKPGLGAQTVNLTRPFAQLNMGTNDLNETVITQFYGDTDLYTAVQVKAFNKFDLVAGDAIETGEGASQTLDVVQNARKDFTDMDYPTDWDHNKYTNLVYVLVPKSNDLSAVEFMSYKTAPTLPLNAATAVHHSTVTSVPMKPNYRTNIYGSLLSSTTDFTVKIEKAFTEPDFNRPVLVRTVQELREEMANGGDNFCIAGDMSPADQVVVTKSVTLVVSNYTLPSFVVESPEAGKEVILKVYGDGATAGSAAAARRRAMGTRSAVQSEHPTYWAKNGALIQIVSGHHNATVNAAGEVNPCIYATDGGKVEITDGIFAAPASADGTYRVLEVAPGSTGKIEVSGGKFYGQDPTPYFKPGFEKIAIKGEDNYYTLVEEVKWDGTSKIEPARVGNTFTIQLPQHLAWYAEYSKTNSTYGHVVNLIADINLNDQPWPQIGTQSNYFAGTFNGNGHVIKNLKIEGNSANGSVGFITRMWEGAVAVKDVTFDKVTVKSSGTKNYVGVVVGDNLAKITNVTVKHATVSGGTRVGGIAGESYGDITNCTVEDLNLTATSQGAGGLVALFPDGNLRNCTLKTATINGTMYVGGLVGHGGGDGTLNISDNTLIDVAYSGWFYTGQLVGRKGSVNIGTNSLTNVVVK